MKSFFWKFFMNSKKHDRKYLPKQEHRLAILRSVCQWDIDKITEKEYRSHF